MKTGIDHGADLDASFRDYRAALLASKPVDRGFWLLIAAVATTCAVGTLTFLLVGVPTHEVRPAAVAQWRTPPWVEHLYDLYMFAIAGVAVVVGVLWLVRHIGMWRTGNPRWPNR